MKVTRARHSVLMLWSLSPSSPQDLNVKLVEEISSTPGAKYCSVDGAEEFGRIMNKVRNVTDCSGKAFPVMSFYLVMMSFCACLHSLPRSSTMMSRFSLLTFA